MCRPIHFDVSADDPQRAIKFYEEAFGWSFEKWEGGEMQYWMITTGEEGAPGINGGLSLRSKPLGDSGVNAYVCTMGVDDISKKIDEVIESGGQIISPKMPIPGLGWFASAADTEGNMFGLMQDDPSAG